MPFPKVYAAMAPFASVCRYFQNCGRATMLATLRLRAISLMSTARHTCSHQKIFMFILEEKAGLLLVLPCQRSIALND